MREVKKGKPSFFNLSHKDRLELELEQENQEEKERIANKVMKTLGKKRTK